jgi:hypothetical protein
VGGWEVVREAEPFVSEPDFYAKFSLSFIEPELREGYDEPATDRPRASRCI